MKKSDCDWDAAACPGVTSPTYGFGTADFTFFLRKESSLDALRRKLPSTKSCIARMR